MESLQIKGFCGRHGIHSTGKLARMFDGWDVDVSALVEAAPGPDLAATQAAIDLNAVNVYARVVVMLF